MSEITATGLLALVIGVPIVLAAMGIWWLVWKLWLFVVPGLFETGPEMLLHPTYWQFVGMLFLASIIGRILFRK